MWGRADANIDRIANAATASLFASADFEVMAEAGNHAGEMEAITGYWHWLPPCCATRPLYRMVVPPR